jgi:hypothetical protein
MSTKNPHKTVKKTSSTSKSEIPSHGVVNGIQLNIVTMIDYKFAAYYKSLEGAVYLTDNSFTSKNKGTPALQTVCTQGQVLNWLMFPINMDEMQDPLVYNPTARINNIVFLHENGEVYQQKICENLQPYGSLEKGRPFLQPPVFYYWAGSVKADLPPGNYRYRLIFEVDDFYSPAIKYYLNLDTPSLKVVPIGASK